jgi:hypothetical protein
MTDLAATPATFLKILAAAVADDVIRLAPGAYGDARITRVIPAPGVVRIVSDPASPAVFNTLRVVGGEGLTFEGVSVAFAPTATTVESQNVVSFEAAKRTTFTGGKITAGMAINGVPETSTTYGAYGNIIGWPLGRGVFLAQSSDVEISDSEIWGVQRGLISYKSAGVRILRNHIHDLRRTFIAGDASDLTIAGNRLTGTKPWRWGETPIGDHGDFIALFPSALGPMSNVVIADNVAEQTPGGAAILGFTLASIRTLEVRGNLMRGTDHQGIVATDVIGAVISDNLLMGRAGILLRTGTERVVSSGNMAAYYEDRLKGASGNTLAGPRKLVSEMALPGPIRVVIVSP